MVMSINVVHAREAYRNQNKNYRMVLGRPYLLVAESVG